MLVLVCILTILSYVYKKSMKSKIMLPGSIGVLAALIALHGALTVYRGVSVLRQSSWGCVVSGLAFALLGYGAREMDLDDSICIPNSWWQWHSVWHLMMAVAYMSVYLFFRSDLVLGESDHDKDAVIDSATQRNFELEVLPINVAAKGGDEESPEEGAAGLLRPSIY
jgi:hypothetical protein